MSTHLDDLGADRFNHIGHCIADLGLYIQQVDVERKAADRLIGLRDGHCRESPAPISS